MHFYIMTLIHTTFLLNVYNPNNNKYSFDVISIMNSFLIKKVLININR